jgi:hypothetical protein
LFVVHGVYLGGDFKYVFTCDGAGKYIDDLDEVEVLGRGLVGLFLLAAWEFNDHQHAFPRVGGRFLGLVEGAPDVLQVVLFRGSDAGDPTALPGGVAPRGVG